MSENQLLIRGGRVVDPATGRDEIGDVLIEGKRIVDVGSCCSPSTSDVDVLDATGLLVTPGLIDMHAHLREPGNAEVETILTGARAAVAGGITTVACFPNTEPAIDNEASAEFVVLQGKRAGYANVFPIGAVTVGRAGERLSEMAGLTRAGAVAFSDGDRTLRSAEMMRRGLLYAKMFDLPVIAHCEDADLRGNGVMNYGRVALRLGLAGIPDVAEDIVVARDIRLAGITQGKLHIAHMSTKNAVEQLREAKGKGIQVTGEVTPPHFTLTEDSLTTYDPNFKMIPPLRTVEDAEALIAGLMDGTIDVIASGHAPHALEEKDVEFVYAPPGVVGLETLFPVSYTELVKKRGMPLPDLLAKLTINPAKLLLMDGTRGSLEPEKLADVSVFNVDSEYAVDTDRFRSKSRNTCFDRMSVFGRPVYVFVSGRCLLRDGHVVGEV